jgi:hypothetical protein
MIIIKIHQSIIILIRIKYKIELNYQLMVIKRIKKNRFSNKHNKNKMETQIKII